MYHQHQQGYGHPQLGPPSHMQHGYPTPGVWRCPYCGGGGVPITMTKTSQAGWVLFWVLLLTTCILCWIGFFIKETYRVCPSCGSKVG